MFRLTSSEFITLTSTIFYIKLAELFVVILGYDVSRKDKKLASEIFNYLLNVGNFSTMNRNLIKFTLMPGGGQFLKLIY